MDTHTHSVNICIYLIRFSKILEEKTTSCFIKLPMRFHSTIFISNTVISKTTLKKKKNTAEHKIGPSRQHPI